MRGGKEGKRKERDLKTLERDTSQLGKGQVMSINFFFLSSSTESFSSKRISNCFSTCVLKQKRHNLCRQEARQ